MTFPLPRLWQIEEIVNHRVLCGPLIHDLPDAWGYRRRSGLCLRPAWSIKSRRQESLRHTLVQCAGSAPWVPTSDSCSLRPWAHATQKPRSRWIPRGGIMRN